MGKLILTVDDAGLIRRLVSVTLRGTGHEVIEAPDGAAALDLLKARAVDLIITDLNMPRMDGLELTKQTRQLPQYQTVPILLLTTESDPTIKFRGKMAGATGWLVKPFSPNQLLAIVAKLLPS
ncbi:response regulator [Opitutaceae bacterium EW11]|nr:response regulator [Opitutaceae bacterium EW11]